MVNFEIKNYGNNVVMLVRTKSIEPSKGLPPTSSQCIIMDDSDVNILIDRKSTRLNSSHT